MTDHAAERLSMATLARARLSLVPPYERFSTATMAHVGVGAFAGTPRRLRG